jgi:NADPH:quinone reductase
MMTKAVLVEGAGGIDRLRIGEIPAPRPGRGEILVEVAAAGINRADIEQRQGEYAPPPGASPILGLEMAGTVAEVGEGVTSFEVGARVMALVAGGAYAGHAVASEELCFHVPATLSDVQAAAVPEAYFTVWSNVFERARLQPGETFLVHGGSSGVGSAAIQLANAWGARVLATARSDEKCAACVRVGALQAINYTSQDFVEVARSVTGGQGVDVILDMVGGSYLDRNVSILARHGRLVHIDCQEAARCQIDLLPVITRNLTIMGSVLRPTPLAEKARLASRIRTELLPWLEAGRLSPLISQVFPLERVQEAHALVESSQHIGKVVLTMA